MPGDGTHPDPMDARERRKDDASGAGGDPHAPAPRFSLPPDLLRALKDLDAGAESPLLDETPLVYGDLLEDDAPALGGSVPPVPVPVLPQAVAAPPPVPPAPPEPAPAAPHAPLPLLMSQEELDVVVEAAERSEHQRRVERDAAIAAATVHSHPQEYTPLPPPQPGEPSGLLTQEELDRALRSDRGTVPVAAPAQTAASAPEAAPPLALTQAELDAYIDAQLAAMSAEAAVPGHHHERPVIMPPAAHPQTAAFDEEPLTQEFLDALLEAYVADQGAETPLDGAEATAGTAEAEDNVLRQGDSDSLLEGTPEPEAIHDEAPQLMTQADLDALIAGVATRPAPVPPKVILPAGRNAADIPPPVPVDISGEEPQLMTQADLDALIAGVSSPSAPAPASTGAEVKRQADPDALIANTPGPVDPAGDDSQIMTQADLDALIAGAAVPAPAAPATSEVLTQADLDALIAGAAVPAPAVPATSEVLTQADLDALIAGAAAQPEPSEEPAYSQADIDALINGQSEEAAPLTPDPGFEALLGSRREDDALGRGGLDSLLVGHDPGEDISISDEHVDALLAELDRPRAAPVEEEPLSQELLDAILASAAAAPEAVDVGLENLAAAASTTPPDPTPLSADDLAELIGASLVPAPEVEAEAEERAPESLDAAAKPRPLLAFVRRHPLRLASAIAAGVLAGAWTYVMLDTMRVYRPSLEQYIARQDAPLDVVNAQARRLIDEGAYGEAVTLLDAALARTHASPERADAGYLRVEALYKGFSGDAYTPEYDTLHARIDETLATAPQHPRAAEALLWKARLYAVADLPYAEADVYANIIANHGDADGLDAILHDAAALALRLDEPLKAVEYTRQLIQAFPGSPHAGGARLLMADAYRRAGALDDARTLYVRVAQAQPGTPAGAEAHYRLGEMSFAEGNYARAIQDLSTYLSSTTTAAENAKVFLLLAKAYEANGQLKEAHERLEELINFFPESEIIAEAYVVLSQVLEDQGQRDQAVNLAMQAAARFPDNPLVLQNSGEFLGLTGNAFGAATALVNAHVAGAGNPELLLSAARYFRVAGMPGNARDTYETLRAAYPRSSQALTGVVEAAEVLYEEGDAPAAMAQLEEMLATTKGRPERLDGVRALLRMTREMGIQDRTVELATEAAGLSEEPEVLAESALALFAANALTQGQEVFNRVDLARVRNKTAFDLLMGLGRGLLQVDPVRGLGRMEEAYLAYPNIRTPQSDLELLSVYLATGRAAAARRVVMELASHVNAEPVDTPLFLDAATAWGDWLYGRGDYRAAADAYTLVLEAATVNGRPVSGLRSDPNWAKFQRANALFELANYSESLPLYEAIAASDVPWAQEARIKADHAQLEQRLRGVKTASTAG